MAVPVVAILLICSLLAIMRSWCLDNLSFGRRENLPLGVEFLQIDLGTCSEIDLLSAIHTFGPYFVIHFAAVHFISYCMEYTSETFASNVRATEVLVRALEDTPAQKLVFAR
jgi:UDP-glucose 4-epimerase